MLQIGARLRVIGHELQGVTEILTRFGDPAGPRFKHSQVVPVISVVCPQMKRCFSFRNRLLQLPGAGQRLRQQRVQVGIGRRQARSPRAAARLHR